MGFGADYDEDYGGYDGDDNCDDGDNDDDDGDDDNEDDGVDDGDGDGGVVGYGSVGVGVADSCGSIGGGNLGCGGIG